MRELLLLHDCTVYQSCITIEAEEAAASEHHAWEASRRRNYLNLVFGLKSENLFLIHIVKIVENYTILLGIFGA